VILPHQITQCRIPTRTDNYYTPFDSVAYHSSSPQTHVVEYIVHGLDNELIQFILDSDVIALTLDPGPFSVGKK
jgi:hypothetical protein